MKDHQLGYMLPALPLGPSIKPEQEKPRDEIAEFNSGDHKINGAAQLRRPSAQTPNDALTGATAESPAIVSDVVAAPPSAAPSTTDDGWIEWRGGECPVEKDALVQIRLRDGTEYEAAAYSVVWGHNLDFLDDFLEVVAYRILKDHQ